MIERLLRRTAGEVRVRVTGASLPRFLNACTQGGVRLRRMERVSWDRMDATLSLGDFRKLRSCMGRTGCRVHILERRGVPFVLAHLLPRTALLRGWRRSASWRTLSARGCGRSARTSRRR